MLWIALYGIASSMVSILLGRFIKCGMGEDFLDSTESQR